MEQLAEHVSFVTQDNFLFRCSILENIRLGNPAASDEEVKAAARAAQCEEFILKLPQGYDTPAGEAGKRLSGGEKQRVAIARMMLKNAPIVIMDEATAFTDPENEEKLQQSIAALTKGKTLLVIATGPVDDSDGGSDCRAAGRRDSGKGNTGGTACELPAVSEDVEASYRGKALGGIPGQKGGCVLCLRQ